jgi:hypothetical protein
MECCICYEVRNDEIIKPCKTSELHQFHSECIHKWINTEKASATCPYCKGKLKHNIFAFMRDVDIYTFTEEEMGVVIDELKNKKHDKLDELLNQNKTPRSSELYEYTVFSLCLENGFFDQCYRMLQHDMFFSTTVDFLVTIELEKYDITKCIIKHENYLENRTTKHWINKLNLLLD